MRNRALLIFALVLGCGETAPVVTPPAVGRFEFQPAAVSADVAMEQVPSGDQSQLTLIVVGDLATAHGLAFRLEYDPAVLGFVGMQPSGEWTAARVIQRSKETRPGLAAAVISARGVWSGLPAGKRPLATVTFSVHGNAPSAVKFVSAYSSAVDPQGAALPIFFAGGEWREVPSP